LRVLSTHLLARCSLPRSQLAEAALRGLAATAGDDVTVEVDRRTGSGGVRYVLGGAPRYAPYQHPLQPPAGRPWTDALFSNLTLLALRVVPLGVHGDKERSHLMLSVHVDTQWTGEAAADNSVHVATLLEVAAAVLSGPAPPASPLIFLLQSGEEDGMLGAQAFVLRHPWARLVRGVVNLEAMGSGGRPVLFQATPGAGWLLRQTAGLRAPPVASVAADDVFSSGVINSDTDVRIYRDYGYDAVDLAYLHNGHVYHTAGDNRALLERDAGAVQLLGDALVELMRAANTAERDVTPLPAFYDAFGTLLTHARPSAGSALSLLAAAMLAVARTDPQAPLLACAVLLSWFTAPLAAAAFARCVASVAPLSFYSRPALAVCLYAPPAMLGAMSGLTALADALSASHNPADAQARLMRATALAWSLLFAIAAAAGMGSSYLPLSFALFPGAALLTAPAALPLALAWPAMLLCNVGLGLVRVLSGLAGRSDATLGAAPVWMQDAMLAAAIGFLTALLTSYLTPLLVTREALLKRTLSACLLLALTAAVFACSVQPYDAAHPRPVMMTHVLDLHTERSAILLASLAPGALEPLAQAVAADFRSSAGQRGRGAGLTHDCAATPLAALLTVEAHRACELRMVGASTMEAQARAAAPGMPRLTVVRWIGDSQAVVHLDAGLASRWVLALNPERVTRYAIQAGVHEADAPVDAPLGWALVVRPSAGQGGRWPTLRHAGGADATCNFTLWLHVHGGEGTALRLRADHTVETVAWAGAKAALPRTAALFGKATLPQALAILTQLHV